jgi:FHS family L-fucose permease-like MFS transporter
MIGRWTGAVSVFNFSKKTKQLLIVLVPLIAFGIICLANYIKGNDISDFKYYPIMILFLIGANLYSQEKPVKLMLAVSILAALFILTSLPAWLLITASLPVVYVAL